LDSQAAPLAHRGEGASHVKSRFYSQGDKRDPRCRKAGSKSITHTWNFKIPIFQIIFRCSKLTHNLESYLLNITEQAQLNFLLRHRL